MPFQFYCPQGHLLEGHESQMGQQSQCPMCGSVFMIPMMQPQPQQPYAPAPQYGQPGAFGGAPQFGQAPQQYGQAPQQFGQMPGGPAPFPQMEQPPAPAPEPPPPEPQPEPEPEKPPEQRVVRIPCPNGHELETPSDMFGQQALCPYCNTQFELRFEDSLEYKAELAEAKRQKEERFNQLLIKTAIRFAIFVGVMIVGMVLWLTFIRDLIFGTQ